MYSRRDFGKIALAALPVASAFAAKIDSKIGGVQIGVQSYSFRDRPLDAAIQAMVECGLGECELFQGHVKPASAQGAVLREWRLATPLDFFAGVRKKFDDAGINLYAYNLSFNDSFSDEEIDRGFEMAKAMRVGLITASATLTSAKRVAPFAEKHKMKSPCTATTTTISRISSPARRVSPPRWRCRSISTSTSISDIFPRPVTIPWHIWNSITTASSIFTSKTARIIMAPALRSAKAIRRSSRCCCC